MKKHLEFAKEIRKSLEKFFEDRTAWGKGVQNYAFDLLDNYEEMIEYAQRNGEEIPELTEKTLLNGARDWLQYSCGGSALVYDEDIAARLCTPSQLKKTKNGQRNPNSRDSWLDLQADALRSACKRILYAARHI